MRDRTALASSCVITIPNGCVDILESTLADRDDNDYVVKYDCFEKFSWQKRWRNGASGSQTDLLGCIRTGGFEHGMPVSTHSLCNLDSVLHSSDIGTTMRTAKQRLLPLIRAHTFW